MSAVASIEPAALSVEPGGRATVVLRVRNGGTIVDRFDVTVVGPLAPWATPEPAFLSLFPGQEGEVRVTFAPPRAAAPPAGTVPFGVRVVPAANQRGAVVEEGRITLAPFVAVDASVVPQTSRGSRAGRHEVTIENRGNAPAQVVVGAADPDRLLAFEVSPDRLVVPAGERAVVAVRAAVRDTFLLGARQSHPFSIEIRPSGAESLILRAGLLQGPLLPSWLVPVGGLAAAALVAVIAIPLLTGGADRDLTSGATTRPTATSTPAPTGEPTASASDVAPSESPGDASPTPTATPGPFGLVIDGEEVVMGGALSLRCPPQPADAPCLRDALDTVRALATTLGGPYGGRGIVSTANLNAPNTLPIQMFRDVPFAWLAQNGSATDVTDRIVLDLAPLLASPPGFAYAVVDSAAGPRRFVLPDELARQLLETLYEPNPVMVDPLPTRTRPPFDVVFDPGELFYPFLLSSPSP